MLIRIFLMDYFLPWLLRRGSLPQGEVTLFLAPLACLITRRDISLPHAVPLFGWTTTPHACFTLPSTHTARPWPWLRVAVARLPDSLQTLEYKMHLLGCKESAAFLERSSLILTVIVITFCSGEILRNCSLLRKVVYIRLLDLMFHNTYMGVLYKFFLKISHCRLPLVCKFRLTSCIMNKHEKPVWWKSSSWVRCSKARVLTNELPLPHGREPSCRCPAPASLSITWLLCF